MPVLYCPGHVIAHMLIAHVLIAHMLLMGNDRRGSNECRDFGTWFGSRAPPQWETIRS